MSKPIVPWFGGKRRLASQILPMFPEHTCYVEPFAGAGGLFFVKEPSKVEVLNDLNGELVNLYRVVKHHLVEFVRQFQWALTSRQIFEWALETPPETLTDIQRAARFIYIQRHNFSGIPISRTFGVSAERPHRFNLTRLEEDLSEAHVRLAQTTIESLDWAACVKRYDRPTTLFYLDPPYLGFKQYGLNFGLAQFREMAALLSGIQGKAVISVSDVPEMHEVFKGFRTKRVRLTYSAGAKSGKAKRGTELVFLNWKQGPSGRGGRKRRLDGSPQAAVG